MSLVVRRQIAFLLTAPFLLWSTWGRDALPVEPDGPHPAITVTALHLPVAAVRAAHLGPFRMEGAWQYTSRHSRVYGYSALLAADDGTFLAFNDGGDVLRFAPPGSAPIVPQAWPLAFKGKRDDKAGRDVESVTYDPLSGQFWAGLEGRNQIVRFSHNGEETGRIKPAGMKHWGINSGPEAMTRLPDGRFVVLREVPLSGADKHLHEALLFAGDPVEHPDAQSFRFSGPEGFSVVDMSLLPDGRVLILMRRLLWPAPMRYAGRIVIADPAQITAGGIWPSVELARIEWALRNDNFEAITVTSDVGGRVAVWLMSDDNKMRVLQRTILWKLTVDPAALPNP